MRFLAFVAMALLLDTCDRLSPNERRVVGTWVQHTIDSSDYTILRSNHVYEVVSDLSSDQLELICIGHWHIQGDEIVAECAVPAPAGLEKEFNNPIHSYRYRINDFLKWNEPHAPISYKRP